MKANQTGLPWFFSDCFKKKLTVIGIIGKTQGVSNEIPPQSMAVRRNGPSPELTWTLSFCSWPKMDCNVFRYSVASSGAAISPSAAGRLGLATGGSAALGPPTILKV